MSEEIQRVNKDEADIDFVAIGKRLKGVFRYLLRKWWVLLIAFVIGGLIGFTISWWFGKKYVSYTVFSVQGQSQTSAMLNSALSLASSLGFSSGKGGGGGYDNNFFASLIKSRRIVKRSLLEKDVIKGKKELLAEHFIDEYQWREKWEKNARLKDFTFKNTNLFTLNALEDSVLSVIYNTVTSKNLAVNYDAANPFNIVSLTTTSKDLSKKLLKHLIDNTSGYYRTDMYELNMENLRVSNLRLDSLANTLKMLDNRVAQMKDNANNMIKQSGLVDLNAAIRDQGLMSVQYSAAVSNYELAKTVLLSEAPILNVVDDPIFSTDVKFIPPFIAILIGGILAGFISGGFMGLRYLVVGEPLNRKSA